MKYKIKKICRCCKSHNLLLYLDLGKQPLANDYHKGNNLPEIPLEVMLCAKCFHNQLSVVVDPDSMFKNYLYVSGTTQTFRKHCSDLADNAVSRFSSRRLNVMDIACNDGTQLEYFRELGCNVMGIDPAENLRSLTKKKKLNILVDYWTQKIARNFKKKFDLMTGTNVFAHVDDVDEFLKASKIALKDEGILILEFPYAENMVANNEFDTVYHEHLSYFLVNSFKILIERLGFHIVDIIRTPIHGGSIRFFIKKGKNKHCQKVYDLIKSEKEKGLLKISTYKKFAQQILKNKKDMNKLIDNLRRKKKNVIGYGASAKGNTMLNYFKINLDYIVDDNPLKWGYMTPGRNILINNPQILKSEKNNLYIVILAWNFYNEIVKHVLKIRGKNKKDTALLYVPFVEKRIMSDRQKYIASA